MTGPGNMFSLNLLGKKWMLSSFSFQCGLACFQNRSEAELPDGVRRTRWKLMNVGSGKWLGNTPKSI